MVSIPKFGISCTDVVSLMERFLLKPLEDNPKKPFHQTAEELVDLVELILQAQEKVSSNLPSEKFLTPSLHPQTTQ